MHINLSNSFSIHFHLNYYYFQIRTQKGAYISYFPEFSVVTLFVAVSITEILPLSEFVTNAFAPSGVNAALKGFCPTLREYKI